MLIGGLLFLLFLLLAWYFSVLKYLDNKGLLEEKENH